MKHIHDKSMAEFYVNLAKDPEELKNWEYKINEYTDWHRLTLSNPMWDIDSQYRRNPLPKKKPHQDLIDLFEANFAKDPKEILNWEFKGSELGEWIRFNEDDVRLKVNPIWNYATEYRRNPLPSSSPYVLPDYDGTDIRPALNSFFKSIDDRLTALESSK